MLTSDTVYHLQPGGAFIQGGPKVKLHQNLMVSDLATVLCYNLCT